MENDAFDYACLQYMFTLHTLCLLPDFMLLCDNFFLYFDILRYLLGSLDSFKCELSLDFVGLVQFALYLWFRTFGIMQYVTFVHFQT